MDAIILAAGLSKRLWPLTRDFPKCLLEIEGKSLLKRLVDQLKNSNVDNIVIVVGHGSDSVMGHLPGGNGISYVHNEDYAVASNLVSLQKALPFVRSDFMVFMADCIYEDEIISAFSRIESDLLVAADLGKRLASDDVRVSVEGSFVTRLGKDLKETESHGCFSGAIKLRGCLLDVLHSELLASMTKQDHHTYICALLDQMIRGGLVKASLFNVAGYKWHEIDSPEDLENAKACANSIDQMNLPVRA